MKLHWIAAAALLVSIGTAEADTIVSGTVNGTWDLSGSPYWVEGDLLVQTGQNLTILPGVEVRFRGPYEFLVNGTLVAVGSSTDSIIVTRDEPIEGHKWHGLSLVNAGAATEIGYARIEYVRAPDPYPDVRGGAIWVDSCSPQIHHCLLQNNYSHNGNANGMGGGVACLSSSATIEFCVIRNNYADSGGGICTLEYGTELIRYNLIEGNTAPNSGGGIYAGVRSSPVIENNVIRGNTAHGWGGGGITLWNWYAAFGTSKTVRNNVVVNNTTNVVGGGFYIRYDYSVLENNTVADNHATGGGGGLYVLNAGYGDFPPDVKNFILWGNTGSNPSIKLEGSTGAAVVVSYSDVAGGWSGTGNIDVDPLFADTDYHLDPASLCIDAGNPAVAYNDVCFPPSQGGARNDIGAYGGPTACGWLDAVAAVDDVVGLAATIELAAAPNPFRATTTMHFTLPEPTDVSLQVYEVSGRMIRSLADVQTFSAGEQQIAWDGTDARGRPVAAGVYLLRLDAGAATAVRRVSVLR